MKLRNQTTTFQLYPERGVVVATIKSYIFNANAEQELHTFITKGIARCSPEIFNPTIGKKLARARAEQAAFLRYRDILQATVNQYLTIIDTHQQALNKVKTCILHQKEYIKSF